MQVIPGVLETNWDEIERKLDIIKTFTDTVHIDLIDGKFCDNKTFFDPKPFNKYSNELFLELHMMVIDPVEFIEPWAEAGFKRFLGHIEHMSSQKEFVSVAKKYGEAGLALDGPTHVNAIKIPFDELDSILVYTSHKVGHSGPPLMDDRLDKVRHLRQLTNIPIEVDGGINDRTIIKAKESGADCFVSTSYITGSENPEEKFNTLKSLLNSA